MKEKEFTAENIGLIQYNGNGKPFQVFLKDGNGYDFDVVGGRLECKWSSGGSIYIAGLAKSIKRKRKIWFADGSRPVSAYGFSEALLTDEQIEKMGYRIIQKPEFVEEIIECLLNW